MTSLPNLPIEGIPSGRPSGETRWQSLIGTDRSDRIYRRILTGFALALPSLIVILFAVLFVESLPALKKFGPSFLVTSTWDPVARGMGRRR